MSIRGLVRVLWTLWCMCLRVVDHEVNQVRDFCYWMVLRMPSKRWVCLIVYMPTAFVCLTCLVWTFVEESKQVQAYATDMFSRHYLEENDWRLELDKMQHDGFSVYWRFVGEDVSFRCVIPLCDLYINCEVLWFHKQGNIWIKVPSKHHYETVYDYVDGNIHTQLDIINIGENDFNVYVCSVYYYKTQSHGHLTIFHLSKMKGLVEYIYGPAGSFVYLKSSFFSVESTKYKPLFPGYELNGVDFSQFKNKAFRCSPFFLIAKAYISKSCSYNDLVKILTGHFGKTQNIMNVDEMTVLPQPDREPLLDFNRQTKTWLTAKFCMDDHLHGVLQFYFNRTRYNDILEDYETVKIYYPLVWVLNPSGINNLLNPVDTLGKDGSITTKQYDPNYINLMKKKLRMMQSDDRFNIGVETHINFEIGVVIFSVAFSLVITIYFIVRSLLAIERFFIYVRSLASKCRDCANDDRKDVYILCSEEGLGWTCKHVLFPLERRGVTAWIHQRNVLLGSLKLQGILDGVEQCRKIVIVLNPDFAVHGVDSFYLTNIKIMLAEGNFSADNILIINENGDQKQIEEFRKFYRILVIDSKCLTAMTDECLNSIHQWIMRVSR